MPWTVFISLPRFHTLLSLGRLVPFSARIHHAL